VDISTNDCKKSDPMQHSRMYGLGIEVFTFTDDIFTAAFVGISPIAKSIKLNRLGVLSTLKLNRWMAHHSDCR
jgi:hypothetical protein